MPRPNRSLELSAGIIAVILTILALRAARAVLEPVVLAYFLALLFKPMHDRLSRTVPKSVSVFAVLSVVSMIATGIGWFVIWCIQHMSSAQEKYSARISERWSQLEELAERASIHLTAQPLNMEAAIGLVGDGLISIFAFLGQVVIFTIVFIFLLLEYDQFHRKLVFGFKPGFTRRALTAFREMEMRFLRFFSTQTVVSLMTGVSTSLITWALGLDFPLVWGAMAFVLNYIPNIGSVIAVIPPVLLAWLQFDTWTEPLIVLFLLAAMQNLLGNYVAPRMMGRWVELSPLIVFVSMLFWGWLWGLVGFFLSVPLTVATQIVCSNVEGLRPIAVFLGSGDDLPPLTELDSAREPSESPRLWSEPDTDPPFETRTPSRPTAQATVSLLPGHDDAL